MPDVFTAGTNLPVWCLLLSHFAAGLLAAAIPVELRRAHRYLTTRNRRQWLGRLPWPGHTTRTLPIVYGPAETPIVAPCRPLAPDDAELREWILTERLLDTLDPCITWSAVALPEPVLLPLGLSARQPQTLEVPTARTWVVPALTLIGGGK